MTKDQTTNICKIKNQTGCIPESRGDKHSRTARKQKQRLKDGESSSLLYTFLCMMSTKVRISQQSLRGYSTYRFSFLKAKFAGIPFINLNAVSRAKFNTFS